MWEIINLNPFIICFILIHWSARPAEQAYKNHESKRRVGKEKPRNFTTSFIAEWNRTVVGMYCYQCIHLI